MYSTIVELRALQPFTGGIGEALFDHCRSALSSLGSRKRSSGANQHVRHFFPRLFNRRVFIAGFLRLFGYTCSLPSLFVAGSAQLIGYAYSVIISLSFLRFFGCWSTAYLEYLFLFLLSSVWIFPPHPTPAPFSPNLPSLPFVSAASWAA